MTEFNVCVMIHLECWSDKARVEIITWAAVGVAHQQQFSYIIRFQNFCSVNTIVVAFDVHAAGVCKFNSYSSVKRPSLIPRPFFSLNDNERKRRTDGPFRCIHEKLGLEARLEKTPHTHMHARMHTHTHTHTHTHNSHRK